MSDDYSGSDNSSDSNNSNQSDNSRNDYQQMPDLTIVIPDLSPPSTADQAPTLSPVPVGAAPPDGGPIFTIPPGEHPQPPEQPKPTTPPDIPPVMAPPDMPPGDRLPPDLPPSEEPPTDQPPDQRLPPYMPIGGPDMPQPDAASTNFDWYGQRVGRRVWDARQGRYV